MNGSTGEKSPVFFRRNFNMFLPYYIDDGKCAVSNDIYND